MINILISICIVINVKRACCKLQRSVIDEVPFGFQLELVQALQVLLGDAHGMVQARLLHHTGMAHRVALQRTVASMSGRLIEKRTAAFAPISESRVIHTDHVLTSLPLRSIFEKA